MTENTSQEGEPVYLAVCVEDIAKSPRELYKTVKDVSKFVNSPEGKSIGARFKKFGTPREALDFLASGDHFMSPKVSNEKIAEPNSPFPGLNRPQMSEFKKYIEKGDMEGFLRLVNLNPRYLVNTGADVASIVMEGFRYNALHIAAKSGQVAIVRQLLTLVHDVSFLTRLYGTSEQDVLQRQTNILVSYLNTPDKGNCDTPLHFATKYGKIDVVREIAKEKLIDRTVRNKAGNTAMEAACERYNEEDKSEILKEIQLAIEGFFVFLIRHPVDNEARLVVSKRLEDHESPSAIAGPLKTEMEAMELRTNWLTLGKDIKRSDFDKGYEKMGRTLCEKHTPRIGWYETWRFIAQHGPIDVTSDFGLRLLQEYLGKRRRDDVAEGVGDCAKDDSRSSKWCGEDARRRILDFEILDESDHESESGNGAGDAYEENSDSEQFFDTITSPEEIENILNDSIGDLALKFASLTFCSPQRNRNEQVDSENEEEDDGEEFTTPPSTPPPTFLLDSAPCKIDNDLLEVLCKIPEVKLKEFPLVEQYVRKLERLNPVERLNWPGIDSPRRISQKKKINYF